MGAVDGVTWHTPTAADFAELYGSADRNGNPNGIKRLGAFAAESFTPLSGTAFGPNRNNVTLTADNRVTNADPNINYAVFVPAGGLRRGTENGAVYNLGSGGFSWSSTTSTPANGYYLSFHSTAIEPQHSNLRTLGFSVRCIRD